MTDIRAIIFDLDGVICSTDRYHYLAWKALADRLDIPFDEQKNKLLRGVSRMESLEIILGDLGFLKYLRRDDRPGGAPVTELFLLGKPDLPAGEIILNFVFVIYQNPAVNGIHQNPANAPGAPVAAKFGFIPIAVEGRADGAAPQPLVVVEGKILRTIPASPGLISRVKLSIRS